MNDINTQQAFRILTIGWSPSQIRRMFGPIQKNLNIVFFHGIIGDPDSISRLNLSEGMHAISLSPPRKQRLCEPDMNFLTSLEAPDVPTVRNMIMGDRVLNQISPDKAMAYAYFIAQRITVVVNETKPDLILGIFDSLYSGMGLAVSHRLGIPWVSMVYSAIPAGLTAFSTQMNPNALLPLPRKRSDSLNREVDEILDGFRRRTPQVYKNVLSERRLTILRLGIHARNFFNRITTVPEEGRDPYNWPSMRMRVFDIVRRAWNGLLLPRRELINEPPTENYAFFPLQMQPESTVDNWAPYYQDQLGLVKQVLRALPANCILVVKLHYIDPDNYSRAVLKGLLKLPGLKIVNPMSNSRSFLQGAKLVFGIQGTACLEAGMLGKPTLIFGDSQYQYFPNTERGDSVSKFQEQIKRLIVKEQPSDEMIKTSIADYVSRYQHGTCNDWAQSPNEKEVENLIKLFDNIVLHYRRAKAI